MDVQPSKLLRVTAMASVGLLFGELCLAQSTSSGIPAPSAVFNIVQARVTWQGRAALRITDANPNGGDDAERMAILPNTTLEDGTINVDLTGDTAANAPANLRGFVGIAFRVSRDASHFECFYLRPKNGRSADPVQRSHSAQYVSVPGYPWDKLRAETPGKYEAYVDIVPGQWTHVRIQFAGRTARLFVNGAAQPTLVVTDLKQTPAAGAVALWIGPGTIAHFANLKISH
jgi:hypothetical protein